MSEELQAIEHLPYSDVVKRWFAGELGSTVAEYTGMKVVSTGSGESRMLLEADGRFGNTAGTLQGGILTAVADSAMGLALATTFDVTDRLTALGLKVNFVRPVKDDTLKFDAKVAHRGRRSAPVNCDVTNREGKLVGNAARRS